MEIKAFMNALLGDWVALMSGIGSIVLLILDYYLKKKTPKWIVLSLAGFCLLLATVRIWSSEYLSRIALEQKLAVLTQPSLSGEVRLMSIAPAGKKGEDTLLTISVMLQNTGAPSIAKNFVVKLRKPDGTTIIGQQFPIPAYPVQLSGEHGKAILIFPSEYLVRTASNQPIPNGGAVFGYLIQVIDGVSQSEIDQPGYSVLIEIEDINGKAHQIAQRMGELPAMNFLSSDIQPRGSARKTSTPQQKP